MRLFGKLLAFAALNIVFLVGASTTSAQTLTGSIKAEIPFAFKVKGVTYAPGNYRFNSTSERNYVLIENVDSGKSRIAGAYSPSRPAAGKYDRVVLRFYRYGDTYFLREISSQVRDLVIKESRLEKKKKVNFERTIIELAL